MPAGKISQTNHSYPLTGAAGPKLLTPEELHRLYAGTPVPPHRYLAPMLAAAASSRDMAHDPAKWLAGISDINLSSVVNDWLNTNRNTDYEQLRGVELDPDTGRLTATLITKQRRGYSGEPDTAGSRENVAFWIDWGSGFQYEGAASVAVYDFSSRMPAALEHQVSLPVDFRLHLRQCGKEQQTVTVCAVLSWNTPSSAADPNTPVVWGNSLKNRISIPYSTTIHADNRISRPSGIDGTNLDRFDCVGRIIHAAVNGLPPEQVELAP
jgi:hypothetical protein